MTKICAFAARSTAFLGSFASPSNTRALLAPVRPSTPLTVTSMVSSIPAQTSAAEDEQSKRSADARKAAASKPLDVHVMGLSHHNAAVDVREKLAIPGDQWVEAAAELVAYSNGAIEEVRPASATAHPLLPTNPTTLSTMHAGPRPEAHRPPPTVHRPPPTERPNDRPHHATPR